MLINLLQLQKGSAMVMMDATGTQISLIVCILLIIYLHAGIVEFGNIQLSIDIMSLL